MSFKIGDEVRLSPKGRRMHPRTADRIGVVVKVGGHWKDPRVVTVRWTQFCANHAERYTVDLLEPIPEDEAPLPAAIARRFAHIEVC